MTNTPAFKFTSYAYAPDTADMPMDAERSPSIEVEHILYDHDMDMEFMLQMIQNFLSGTGYHFESSEYLSIVDAEELILNEEESYYDDTQLANITHERDLLNAENIKLRMQVAAWEWGAHTSSKRQKSD